MNISFWLPLCVLLMLSVLILGRNYARFFFLLATFMWCAFISNRGLYGPDTFVYQQPLSVDSGLGLWIIYFSFIAQFLGISLVNLHAVVYWLASFSITLLPDKLFRALAVGWCLYLALGGFVADTSTIRWSFCYLFLNMAFVVLVKTRPKWPDLSVIMTALILSLGFFGYPSVVLFLFPPILLQVLSFFFRFKLKIPIKANMLQLLRLIIGFPLILISVFFAISVIIRYTSDIAFFNEFVGFDLSISKISLSIFSAFLIAFLSKELIMITSEKNPSGGGIVFTILFCVLAIIFLSSMAVRLAPIFTTLLVIFCYLRTSTFTASIDLARTLPRQCMYALLMLVPASYIYSQSYILQSFGATSSIGLYYFP